MIRLTSDADIARAWRVMSQLRPHLDPDALRALVRLAEEKQGYQLFALEEAGEIAALCGVMPMITLYYDHCLWVCDLVTDEGRRSQGYGARLLGEVEGWARDNGYRQIALSSGVQRVDAHRFYERRMGYEKNSYQFRRQL